MIRAAIINGFDPGTYKGGIETFVLQLKRLLEEQGAQVDLHFLSPEPTLPARPFPVKSLSKVVPDFLLKCFMLGRAFSKIEKRYELVISNNFYGLGYFSPGTKSFNIFHSTHAGYADALRGKVPDSDYRLLKYVYGHLGDRLSGRGKTKIAVSGGVRDELSRYYGWREVTVVPHGVDTAFFRRLDDRILLRKKWDVPGGAFAGVFVGRWETGKGIDVLEEVIKLHPEITWLLATGPSQCPLAGMNNVRAIRDADRTTVRELYSLSDFMLFPSYYEGFGLAIIEAMACNLPVICTETGVAKDFLRYAPLRKLILPFAGRDEMVREILGRISLLRKRTSEKEEIGAFGRLVIERDYPLEQWKKTMAAVLGLSSQ
ncbi:MAG: glycosyltransferase family 4 protein [Nitrospirae bacterium]|nr:glycosyltransferase family 4 protein [Nitrospirota bacterium]